MSNLIWISTIGVGVVSLWPLIVLIRRWWFKPYSDPKRILWRIQRSLRLTSSEVRRLKKLLDTNQDPIAACQFLLDPTRWPVDFQDDSAKELYAKVFKKP